MGDDVNLEIIVAADRAISPTSYSPRTNDRSNERRGRPNLSVDTESDVIAFNANLAAKVSE